jgi:hypothetical protein
MGTDADFSRRWINKALIAAVIGMVGLVGIIYNSIASDIRTLDTVQRQHGERLVSGEIEVKGIQRDLQEIKDDVKSILREVKK